MKTISERLAQQYPDTSANESAEVVGAARAGRRRHPPGAADAARRRRRRRPDRLRERGQPAARARVGARARKSRSARRSAPAARRLVLQMLSESLVLALAGGALGLLLAYLAIAPIQTLSAGSIPRVNDITIDGTGAAVRARRLAATGVLFGLAPAWQASRAAVGAVLKEGGRSSTAAAAAGCAAALLVVEVALSIVLLVGAALLLRSFARLTNVDPGLPARPRAGVPRRPAERVVSGDRISASRSSTRCSSSSDALPEVTAAGMVQTLPMRGDYFLSFDDPGAAGAEARRRAFRQPPRRQPGLLPDARHSAAARPRLHRSRRREVADGRRRRRGVRASATSRTRIRSARASTSATAPTASTRSSASSATSTTPASRRRPARRCTCRIKQDVVQHDVGRRADRRRSRGRSSAAVRQAVQAIDPGAAGVRLTPLATVVSDSVAQRRFSMLLLGALRRDRAVPRRGRPLRRRGLHRQPAHAGDRRAHGDRRRSAATCCRWWSAAG